MRHLLLLLTIFAWVPAAIAETFFDPASKAEITLPEGWQHDEKDDFGYHILIPEAKRGVRIHIMNARDKTLIEGLNTMVKTFAAKVSNKGAITSVIGVREIVTTSGTKGLCVTTGSIQYIGPDKWKSSVVVWHYLFLNSDGRLVCVCLYRDAKVAHTDTEADALILPNVRIK